MIDISVVEELPAASFTMGKDWDMVVVPGPDGSAHVVERHVCGSWQVVTDSPDPAAPERVRCGRVFGDGQPCPAVYVEPLLVGWQLRHYVRS